MIDSKLHSHKKLDPQIIELQRMKWHNLIYFLDEKFVLQL